MGGGGDPEIKDTEAQKALADMAKDQWRIYNEEFVPAENQWISETYKLNDASEYAKVADTGTLAGQSAFKGAPAQLALATSAQGKGVNSGSFVGGLNTTYTDMARAVSDTVNSGQIAQQSRFMTGLGNISAVGMGMQTQATQSMGDLASNQNAYAINSAQNSSANNMGLQQLAGTTAGIAAQPQWTGGGK